MSFDCFGVVFVEVLVKVGESVWFEVSAVKVSVCSSWSVCCSEVWVLISVKVWCSHWDSEVVNSFRSVFVS